ncbi:surface antigen (D15) [Tamlana sedimentorum]|uniref:Surface antigen (D15) n=1 Tax=Neotamlana sedimentorum TaxID=1435349 RepID=A0A0D7WDR7_9FLAO|nr:surface antigen (D15) [Tamlana sedimentorum]
MTSLFFGSVYSQNLNLKIIGKTEFETQIIDSLNYTKTHPNSLSIKQEVEAIKLALETKGHIELKPNPINKVNDSSFHIQLTLNKRYKQLRIFYNETDLDLNIIKQISSNYNKTYFDLPFTEIEDGLNYINNEISKTGLPFAKLMLSNIIINNDLVEARLTTSDSNKKRIINSIIIKGYEKFPKSYLKHYLKIKQNQVFNLDDIQTKTNQLNNLNFASELKSPEVLFTKDSTSLYLYIEKRPRNTFDGFLGFGTNEETNKIQFDGYLNLNLTNNLNYGESLSIFYKSDENDQQTFEITTKTPYLFNTAIGIDLALHIFKKDSSFTTANQSAKLNYQINAKHKISTGINSTTSSNLLNITQNLNINDYESTFYTLNYEYLSLNSNNLLFPIKSKFYIEGGLGKRKTNINEQQQSQFTLEAFKIFYLNNRNSFFLRTNNALLSSNAYFENELYRFGGINSIRGFEENSIYANLFSVINTEYRYQLSSNIYINTIFDAAYFENDITLAKEKLFGYGIGLGILTKSGLFKLNYANGKFEDSNFKFSNSKIHISLKTNF